MGTLKPGTTYIYERADGVTYAREAGSPANTRKAIGWDYDVKKKHEQMLQDQLWARIRYTAKTNPALQDALDRVIVLYELCKQDSPNDPPDWHPV